MTEPEHHDPVETLAELYRSAPLVESEVDLARSRRCFVASLDGLTPGSETLKPRWQGGAGRWVWLTAAALSVAAVYFVFLRTAALTFTVEGAELSGQYVSAPEYAAAAVRFSDASSVVAAPGSRLRIEETSRHGARVLLESGRATVHVARASSTFWTFAAGPFEVHVTGTRFDLEWDPASQTCEVVLHEGSVQVHGPAGSGPLALRSGQRFHGDAKRRTMQLLELNAAAVGIKPAEAATSERVSGESRPARGVEREVVAESDGDTDVAPSDGVSVGRSGETAVERGREEPRTREVALPAPAAARDVGGGQHKPVAAGAKPAKERAAPSGLQGTWAENIAQGRFRQVLRAAQARGVADCLASCAASDLRALSDAARYTGDGALASKTLLTLRRRFSGAAGTEAAFLLGRLDENRGARAAALTWYANYLREAPSGSFAAEALAGKVRVVKATQGNAAAQPLAREYLSRFPKGVHVPTARQILQGN